MKPEQLPDEFGLKKPIQELKPVTSTDELGVDRWAQDKQKPPNTKPPEGSNQVELSDEEVAEMGQAAAKAVVNSDLRTPQQTEMPDGIISESPLNQPDGTKHIGAFGPIEQRVADEEGRKPKKGWIGTAYVDGHALDEAPKPQAAAAPPPPPPPEGPFDGPFSGDDNKMPPQDYDKAARPPVSNLENYSVGQLQPDYITPEDIKARPSGTTLPSDKFDNRNKPPKSNLE